MMGNLYTILGVAQSASEADIKAAYRALAKELHPDFNRDDERIAEKFKLVNNAYKLLSDKKQRKKYDRGEIDEQGRPRPKDRQPKHPYQEAAEERARYRARFDRGSVEEEDLKAKDTNAFGMDVDGKEDLFAEFFGKKQKKRSKEERSSFFRRPKRKGIDVTYEITIGFEESIRGSTRRLMLNDGREVDVKIPLGIKEGQIIRLPGQGGPGVAGGNSGDALIEILVADHPLFKRDGSDIHMECPISLDEAVLGGDIEIPTPHGRLTVRVPKGTSSGKRLRLRGKGVRKASAEGDLYVHLTVMLPDVRDKELEILIRGWTGGKGPELREKAGLK
ncbi:DnaJ C-terminal domain-containing protein [Temperatibacter marinus]|uniref:DnaJ C-terminal domain-containing protein n=1 Tax=Temperatibacter marinus TaxID=1456591 RepID=A0AA52EFM2_9PROT|nr:DnaJ C-terminal domain-containing protein [Temperatibacter marinus]WND01945.1 DnaJ C-terminal domain-containing protein [Temperatibacter marinus]